MRHSKYVKADTVNDTDTYQWGQFKVQHYAGQRIVTRLVGYRAQRASGNGERGGRVPEYLTPIEWTRRHLPRYAQLMRKIRRNWGVREAFVPQNRSVKTKAKRYQSSAPPRQFPTQIPTEHNTLVPR
jgi:hypothetical protein